MSTMSTDVYEHQRKRMLALSQHIDRPIARELIMVGEGARGDHSFCSVEVGGSSLFCLAGLWTSNVKIIFRHVM
jgi:hypothetical protein